jgi:hypothetical protein
MSSFDYDVASERQIEEERERRSKAIAFDPTLAFYVEPWDKHGPFVLIERNTYEKFTAVEIETQFEVDGFNRVEITSEYEVREPDTSFDDFSVVDIRFDGTTYTISEPFYT